MESGLAKESIAGLATIDLKSDEIASDNFLFWETPWLINTVAVFGFNAVVRLTQGCFSCPGFGLNNL